MKRPNFLRPSSSSQPFITVVSGLPRSGTSMMMQILAAGGVTPLTDGKRLPDVNNTKGYFELEQVKKLSQSQHDWIVDAKGKSVKVVSTLLKYLPEEYDYRIIFMRRDEQDILASQHQMLLNLGQPTTDIKADELIERYQKHLNAVIARTKQKTNCNVLEIDYANTLSEPKETAEMLSDFLAVKLMRKKMIAVIDPLMKHH